MSFRKILICCHTHFPAFFCALPTFLSSFHTRQRLLCNIFRFFRYPLSLTFYVPNSNSLECYDKSELSNQSSEDELPPPLQISLYPYFPPPLFFPAAKEGEDLARQRKTYCRRIFQI